MHITPSQPGADSPQAAEPKPTAFSRRWFLVAAGILAAFAVPKWFQHASMFSHIYDTGIYDNLVANLATGRGYWSSILERHHLGEHFSPIVLAFVPLYWAWPDARWLLVAQGIGQAIAVLLAGRYAVALCRQRGAAAPAWLIATAIALAFFYRPWLGAYAFEFQPINLGMPMTMAALVALAERRWRWFVAMCLLLATTRESAALTVAGLGVVAWLQQRRPRLAAGLVASSCVLAAFTMLVVMPAFRDQAAWAHVDRIAPWDHWDDKALYLFSLVAWLLFLPLLGWRVAAGALPGVALNLSVHAGQYSMNCHYDSQLGAFLVAGGVLGLVRLAPKLDAIASRATRAWKPAARRLAVAGAFALLAAGLALRVHAVLPKHHLIGRLVTGELLFPAPERRHIQAALADLPVDPGETLVMGFYAGAQAC
ncbi:MAG: DUF2079 domain-containing protein, partial [Planctomycetota bacterium]